MKFEITKENIAVIKTDAVLIKCKKTAGEKKVPGTLFKNDGGPEIDKALSGLVKRIIAEESFTGEFGEHRVFYTDGRIGAKKVILLGAGEEDKEFNLDMVRKAGAKTAEIADELKAKNVSAVLQSEKTRGLSPAERGQAFVEGVILGSYRFNRYKKKKGAEKPSLETFKIIYGQNPASVQTAVFAGTHIAEAVNLSRDLTNMSGADLTPETLAGEAVKIAKESKLSCAVMDEKAMKKERMNLILAVSKGSANPPRLIHIKYAPPKRPKARIALVGKGITFDSGGYNLKPAKAMDHMKSDMAGAAAVLSVMKLMSVFKPNVSADAYIPATENMIDGRSHRPGDVITSRNGRTVELANMDCEGRLVLADAVDYALEGKPDIIIDLATLTGGVLYALGEIYTAILGNDQRLIDALIKSARDGGEPTWQLPLEKEYLKGYKEGAADLTNTGKTLASTISGALFISEFVGKTRWAHLDIAESSWTKEERPYRPKGATGVGVQTVIRYLMNYGR